jgi:alpha-glucosidase
MHESQWWRSAVIYEVYIRSFADANGDGDGDVEGIRSRLPYLRELGIDAIWITPWYPSPMADGATSGLCSAPCHRPRS